MAVASASSRSRSPRRSSSRSTGPPSLPGLREDAPSRRGPSRGALPALSSPDERDQAIKALQDDYFSASHARTMNWKWKTIETALKKWRYDPFPPSLEKLVALGAALKSGGYQSAESYVLFYRTASERKGYGFDAVMNRAVTDIIRSCRRGRGGVVKPTALPLLRLNELGPLSDEQFSPRGPVGAACAVISGSWFLTREVELSTARAALIEFGTDGFGNQVVRWRLPASKNDQEAHGVARAHGCCCRQGNLASCPFHALELQLNRLRRLFPSRFSNGVPDFDLPLFPDEAGAVVSKEAMTETIRVAAQRLGVPLEASDGTERVSGHSLRITGAQGLARAGVDTWAIQLLGRWGSSTVLEYVQAVPLELSASWARAAAVRSTMEDLLSAPGRTPPPLLQAAPQSHGHEDPHQEVAAAAASGADEAHGALQHEQQAVAPASGKELFVQSDARIWHRVPSTLRVGPSSAWSAACGWKFAGKEARQSDELPDAVVYKFLCARCLPALRASLKAAV